MQVMNGTILKFLLTTRLHFFECAFAWKLGYTGSLDLFG